MTGAVVAWPSRIHATHSDPPSDGGECESFVEQTLCSVHVCGKRGAEGGEGLGSVSGACQTGPGSWNMRLPGGLADLPGV